MTAANYPPVPRTGGDWDWVQKIADKVNLILQGRVNATQDVTLNAGATTTTINDPRISATCAIVPAMALSLSAAIAMGRGPLAQPPAISETGAAATGTTILLVNSGIPPNTAGTQFLSLAYTPKNAASILFVDVFLYASNSIAGWINAALFQDATVNALAGGANFQPTATALTLVAFRHQLVAGSISPTTFQVRAGPQTAGTITLNGQSGVASMGGVMASSITVTEYLPGGNGIYVTNQQTGSAVLNHASSPAADQTIRFLIIG
jgi:hypothetical protein